MANKQIKAEFSRWIDAGRPGVWTKHPSDKEWIYLTDPDWVEGYWYIIDDKYAELRKLQIDEPDTEFQVKDSILVDCMSVWCKDCEYRVKPEEWYKNIPSKGVICYVSNKLGLQHQKENVAIITKYTKNEANEYRFFDITGKSWLFAKPVTYDELCKEG